MSWVEFIVGSPFLLAGIISRFVVDHFMCGWVLSDIFKRSE